MDKRILQKYPPNAENLLFALHDIQDAEKENYLSEEDLKNIADYFNLPLSKVMGVATFYSMYSLKPRGKFIIRICESAPCHVAGALNVINEFINVLGLEKVGETTKDKLFTVETSACLGVCGVAPACMINDVVYGNLTKDKIKQIVDDLRAKGGSNV
ncbi:MAG: NAD(P)H-dependent oxidoreductase subunit E [Spirochaetes bacterium]|nr:NAD(P)H-dependent oxidoreductase subunit E [Spirochaetota bacterium]NLJ05889.1 NAD(P)H-dependent oxidoreductase subunit E [Exilispira sp.]MBP8991431.1 NAD(P)H-dependent oxidoreductase subunit E [Spirochaetota bacterium]HNV43363.1 NAD(P)H-dependent oxidoreductase subunit E [Exilispira sp.]HOV46079.1 NAD(P)H-dependent oxidoreductase subunit E [Exilispira sp.]